MYMDEHELAERKDEIQARLKESQIAEKCVKVATKLGEDRGSRQTNYYTNLNYVYEGAGIVIDCDIGANMQGDGYLFVKQSGRRVFDISNSYPYNARKDLPVVTAQCVDHRVLAYVPGDWEKTVRELFVSLGQT